MQGVKLKMDTDGNILIKRVSKSNVYVKCTNDGGEKGENSIGNEILKLSNCALEIDKPMKVSTALEIFCFFFQHQTSVWERQWRNFENDLV